MVFRAGLKKYIPNCFLCLDTLIQTRRMLRDIFSFSKVEQHPKCLDQVIQTQKTIRYLIPFRNNHSYLKKNFGREISVFGYSDPNTGIDQSEHA